MYNQLSSVIKFKSLNTIIVPWAAWLGVVQSLVWIGLTITGILAYKCVIPVAAELSYGSLLRTIFLDVYFTGFNGCKPSTYQTYDSSIIQSVNTVLDPEQIFKWDCVYLGVAVCWFISSVLLLTHASEKKIILSLRIIYSWVFFVLIICCMDVSLGVIFGIDYGRFQDAAYNYNMDPNVGIINSNAAQLLAGEESAIAMMFVSFKGFLLWIINLGLAIALLLRGMAIGHDLVYEATLFMPRKDSDEILTTRPPIRAYEETKTGVFTNEAFVPDNRSIETATVEVNEEAIIRAAHLSRDVNMLESRFRNLDSYQQFSGGSNKQSQPQPAAQVQETVIASAATTSSGFPAPDYSPQPMRANQQQQQQDGATRNQRY